MCLTVTQTFSLFLFFFKEGQVEIIIILINIISRDAKKRWGRSEENLHWEFIAKEYAPNTTYT